MAIKRPDEYQHNNSDLAIVDGDGVRGGRRSVPDRDRLYALVAKADQLKENVTLVRILSDDENGGVTTEVLLVDDTNIDNPAGWQLYSTGGGGGGGGGGASFSNSVSFDVVHDGEQTFPLPTTATGIAQVQKQTPIPEPDGPPVDGQTQGIDAEHTSFDLSTHTLTVLDAAGLVAGETVIVTYLYGGGGAGGSGTGDIDASRIKGLLDDSNFPALTPAKVAQLTDLINDENAQRGPLTLVPQPLLNPPEDGAVEYDGANLYFTVGSTRKQFAFI